MGKTLCSAYASRKFGRYDFFRAIRILKEADLVLAEDTRTSGILLKHFEIKNAMQSHHKFNEHKTVESVVNRIKRVVRLWR